MQGGLESDPVASGFIASHAKPGGNITGTFLDFPDRAKKWLEALKEAVPELSTAAALEGRGRSDVETAFQSAGRQGV